MRILVPWKPVVLVWGLLSAMIFLGFVASSLREGKDPFAPSATKKRGLRKKRSKLITHTKRLEPRISKISTISCCSFVCLLFSITSSRDYLAQYFLPLLLQHDLWGSVLRVRAMRQSPSF